MRTYEPLNVIADDTLYWRSHIKDSDEGTLCGLQIDSQYQDGDTVFNAPEGHSVRACSECDNESEATHTLRQALKAERDDATQMAVSIAEKIREVAILKVRVEDLEAAILTWDRKAGHRLESLAEAALHKEAKAIAGRLPQRGQDGRS